MKLLLSLSVSFMVFLVGCNPPASNIIQNGTNWGVGSFVFKASDMIYPELELRGEIAEEATSLYSLIGLKFRIADETAPGFGIQAPISKERDYDTQALFTLGIAF